jgi:GNAT superfamily N-acetyltransferase
MCGRNQEFFIRSQVMKITRIRTDKIKKYIELDDGTTLTGTRSTRVREGDEVQYGSGRYFVVCHNGLAQIVPAYCRSELIQIGDFRIALKIKEPTTEEELIGMHLLERYHYLTGNPLRLSTLVATTPVDSNFPRVIGYVLMTSAFHSCAPRNKLARQLFSKSLVPSWFAVRIARVVTHPEFRGLGLATLMFRHTIEFCRDHWSLAGGKPLLCEVVAEMFKYVPFARSAGMTYLGDTSGESVSYAINNEGQLKVPHKSYGLESSYELYHKRFASLAEKLSLSTEELLRLVRSPESLTAEQKIELFPLLRSRKPFWCIGLSARVQQAVIELSCEFSGKWPTLKPGFSGN